MHFAFTDQQTEFRDTVRQMLTKECTTDDLPRSLRRTVCPWPAMVAAG